MELMIYDREGKKVDTLQNYSSIQWIRRYSTVGQFEIHVLPTVQNLMYLQKGMRLVNQTTREIGFISYSYDEQDLEDQEEFEVRGYFNNLDQRINTNTHILSSESDVYQLVMDNRRDLDVNLEPTEIGLESSVKLETTWLTLRDTIEKMCELTGWGYRMLANPMANSNECLNRLGLYDRGVRRVKFSDKLSNISFQSREIDYSDYKNYAFVCAQGEGEERTVVEVDLTNGQERYELYIDSRNTSKTYTDEEGNEHTYTDEEYKQLLTEEGIQELADHSAKDTFTCKIDPTDTLFRFRLDYDLGDVVFVESVRYKIDNELYRISQITEIDEDGTETVEISLSKYENEAVQMRGGIT